MPSPVSDSSSTTSSPSLRVETVSVDLERLDVLAGAALVVQGGDVADRATGEHCAELVDVVGFCSDWAS